MWAGFSENLHARDSAYSSKGIILKSRHATTWEGLSARRALSAVVMASPPWGGGADPKLSISEKDSQVGLGWFQGQMAQQLGPEHANQDRSDAPTLLV